MQCWIDRPPEWAGKTLWIVLERSPTGFRPGFFENTPRGSILQTVRFSIGMEAVIAAGTEF